MKQNNYSKLVHTLLDFGEALLDAGAEIARVEDSIARMAKAYGAKKADVFVITSSIVLTMEFDDGQIVTLTRRIRNKSGFDFVKIDRLNALARNCAVTPLPLEELKSSLLAIAGKRPRAWKLYLGSVVAAAAFSIFFGGDLADGAVSGLFALLICFLQLHLSVFCPNNAFFLFITSLVCGVFIYLTGKALPFLHTDLIIIGDIMLLVPGVAITTATRDMVIGDTISGGTKLVESLVAAVTLAGGFMIAMLFFGR